ncbi:MAG: DUF1572 domain-containing protein [Bacteroidetes bacterium]|nr:MAG: DUF1572 domain-containing protein [Bacteroidota bacterium]
MIIETLQKIFKRDLEKLKQEITSYRDESNLWKVDKSIANSSGNLCLHLVGNLNAYIGAEIGKTGYVRNRDLEFSLKNIPQGQLVKMIEDTIVVVEEGLSKLNENDLEREYPLLVFKEKTSTGYFLIHLAVHLGYHLGQVNYHRRLLDN